MGVSGLMDGFTACIDFQPTNKGAVNDEGWPCVLEQLEKEYTREMRVRLIDSVEAAVGDLELVL